MTLHIVRNEQMSKAITVQRQIWALPRICQNCGAVKTQIVDVWPLALIDPQWEEPNVLK